MKRKWVVGCAGIFGIVLVAAVGWKLTFGRDSAADQAAFVEQLTLAKTEGIPTTWQAFAATVRTAKPQENAAKFYQKLSLEKMGYSEFSRLEADLTFRPTPEHVAAALKLLGQKKAAIALVEQAIKFPKCWFNRDWSKGAALPMIEYAYMKYGAKLLALKGSVAAQAGHPAEAVDNIRGAFRIARHAEQEGTPTAVTVSEGIFSSAVRHLAAWAYVHPKEAAYQKAMSDALHAWPSTKLQEMHRGDLNEVLSVVDLSTTESGRTALGIKPEQVSRSEGFISLFTSRTRAKAKIVEAERHVWAAFAKPPAVRVKELKDARNELSLAMGPFPTGSQYYFSIAQEDKNTFLYDQVWESRRLFFEAILRGLSGGSVRKSIKTADLLSPFDGKPINYGFYDRQMTISVSCPDSEINMPPLKFPTLYELLGDAKPKTGAIRKALGL